jgi:CBS domain-containing protein
MKVRELMTREVATCERTASLAEAARLMWERDCGVIPVTERDGTLCGVVTDRDLCMASYLRGQGLHDLRVAQTMSPEVHAVHEDDAVVKAHQLMRKQQVRRLPVVDGQGRVRGILSLNDIALKAAVSNDTKAEVEVARTLSSICRHREPAPA